MLLLFKANNFIFLCLSVCLLSGWQRCNLANVVTAGNPDCVSNFTSSPLSLSKSGSSSSSSFTRANDTLCGQAEVAHRIGLRWRAGTELDSGVCEMCSMPGPGLGKARGEGLVAWPSLWWRQANLWLRVFPLLYMYMRVYGVWHVVWLCVCCLCACSAYLVKWFSLWLYWVLLLEFTVGCRLNWLVLCGCLVVYHEFPHQELVTPCCKETLGTGAVKGVRDC